MTIWYSCSMTSSLKVTCPNPTRAISTNDVLEKRLVYSLQNSNAQNCLEDSKRGMGVSIDVTAAKFQEAVQTAINAGADNL